MKELPTTIELTGAPLSFSNIESVARGNVAVRIAPEAEARIAGSEQLLAEAMRPGDPIYGVNTGFGSLANVKMSGDDLRLLQVNLVRSHSTGVGDPLPVEVVRATMLVLAASLCRGHSGVRTELVQTIVDLLNAGVTPCVPETGSVGASGDLAPLAHIGLVLIGEGHTTKDNKRLLGREALRATRIQPVQLEAKEGLALINGTHLMAGRAALLMCDFRRVFDAALVAAAMSVDTCRATDSTLDSRVHEVRCQTGQVYVAERLRALLSGSQIVQSHVENDIRVQDPYSFRCCPAVLGAAWDAFCYARQKVNAELAAVTDNPLIFGPAGRATIISGGNFHGMPLALPLDAMAIAVAHVAGIAERRVYHMLSGADPLAELPTFLTPQAGLQSGLMIAQYTAAACCNELIGLAHPASVVNLSTCAGMEDYNSFGPRSAAKLARGLQLAKSVVAIELLCAATGLDHHRPLRSGPGVEKAFHTIRQKVAPLTDDRPPAPDIRAIEELIEEGQIKNTE